MAFPEGILLESSSVISDIAKPPSDHGTSDDRRIHRGFMDRDIAILWKLELDPVDMQSISGLAAQGVFAIRKVTHKKCTDYSKSMEEECIEIPLRAKTFNFQGIAIKYCKFRGI